MWTNGCLISFFTLQNGFDLALKNSGIPLTGLGIAHMVESRTCCPLCIGSYLHVREHNPQEASPKLPSH